MADENGEREMCMSLYMIEACCHGCIHEADHEEKHLCSCGFDWTDDEAEEVE